MAKTRDENRAATLKEYKHVRTLRLTALLRCHKTPLMPHFTSTVLSQGDNEDPRGVWSLR